MRSGRNCVALAVWICTSAVMTACGFRQPTIQTIPERWVTTESRLTATGLISTDSARECLARNGWQWARCQ